jgi:hypothetical protein
VVIGGRRAVIMHALECRLRDLAHSIATLGEPKT